jgi:tRNA A58 N-methylase Trm61
MVCPSSFSFILNNPVRRAFTDREAVLAESLINDRSVVLEVGSGNGFFTEVLARMAERVFAVELQTGMVRKLLKRLSASVDNVEIIEQHIVDVELASGSVDVAFIYFVFHEIDEKQRAAEKISEMVKPGGYVSLYEPTIEVSSSQMKETVSMFQKNGFIKDAERSTFLTRFVRLVKRM